MRSKQEIKNYVLAIIISTATVLFPLSLIMSGKILYVPDNFICGFSFMAMIVFIADFLKKRNEKKK